LDHSPIHIFFSLKKIQNNNNKNNSEKRMPEHSENGPNLVKEVQKFKD
jgi:hypothetical protein